MSIQQQIDDLSQEPENNQETIFFGNLNQLKKIIKIFLDWLGKRELIIRNSSNNRNIGQQRKALIEMYEWDKTCMSDLTELAQQLQQEKQKNNQSLIQNHRQQDQQLEKLDEYQIMHKLCIHFYYTDENLIETIKLGQLDNSILISYLQKDQENTFFYQFIVAYIHNKIEQIKLRLTSTYKYQLLIDQILTRHYNLLQDSIQQYGESLYKILLQQKEMNTFNQQHLQQQLDALLLLQLQHKIKHQNQQLHQKVQKQLQKASVECVYIHMQYDAYLNYLQESFYSYFLQQLQKDTKNIELKFQQQIQSLNQQSNDNQVAQIEAEQQWNHLKNIALQKNDKNHLNYQNAISKRKKIAYDNSRYINMPDMNAFKLILPVSAKEFFLLFLSDHEGDTFFRNYQIKYLKSKDVVYSRFTPSIPEYFTDFENHDVESIYQSPECITRSATYKHYLQDRVFHFIPEYGDSKAENKVFFISHKEIYVENEIFMYKIPYAEYFTVRQYLLIEQDERNEHQIHFTYAFCINLIKSTMIQKILQMKSYSENLRIWNDIFSKLLISQSSEFQKKREILQEERKKQFIQKYIIQQSKEVYEEEKEELVDKQEIIEEISYEKQEQRKIYQVEQQVVYQNQVSDNNKIFMLGFLFLLQSYYIWSQTQQQYQNQ